MQTTFLDQSYFLSLVNQLERANLLEISEQLLTVQHEGSNFTLVYSSGEVKEIINDSLNISYRPSPFSGFADWLYSHYPHTYRSFASDSDEYLYNNVAPQLQKLFDNR